MSAVTGTTHHVPGCGLSEWMREELHVSHNLVCQPEGHWCITCNTLDMDDLVAACEGVSRG